MAAETTSPTGSTKTLVPEAGEAGSSNTPAMSAGAFFSKLQHQLSENPKFKDFQHTFQTVQHDLKNKVVDFNKIDMHEAREQYEKAMNQGEKYWKVASKELTDLFEEAVRIVPPEGYTAEAGSQSQATGAAGKAADKRRKDAAVAAAGRKEMLLHRLRSEPAILLVDPTETSAAADGADATAEEKKEGQSEVKEAFASFLQSLQTEGGLDVETWKAKVASELEDEEGGAVLKQTYDSVGECRTHHRYEGS